MDSNMIEDNIDGNFEHEIETKEEKNNADLLNKKRGKVSSSENEDDYSSKHKAKKRTHNPNRKRALQSLLEFYLSDDNLINDKFLSKFPTAFAFCTSEENRVKPVKNIIRFLLSCFLRSGEMITGSSWL